ncbi:MAG: class I SAM-dependent methyltransferase [Reichenbachiella sp.]|uniref:class I SAM-dependent methyltransferase n=1 Tax=Reichenbachiella sp. TaxID=2184521 RepID=UPI003266A62A
MKDKVLHYSEYTTSLFEYDFSIASHALIDACNASIISNLVKNLDFNKKELVILDAGCGTGQVTRMLNGIKGVTAEACDIDPEAKKYFQSNPETKNIKYYNLDFINDELPRFYDAIITRGVYHHVPKEQRPKLLANVMKFTSLFINADEGILEYSSESERLSNCNVWYSFVINEAKRRHLYALATMESDYLRHEKLNTADDGGDLKESPEQFINDCNAAHLSKPEIQLLGDWEKYKGGFYTAILK